MTPESPAPDFVLTLMTADPRVAAAADAAGVNRVGIDLEVHGKVQRQVSRPSWITTHTLEALRPVVAAMKQAVPFARIHPFALGGRDELEQVLALGARVVMLPMFISAAQAHEFVRAVDGRAKPVLLLETMPAVEQLDEILRSDRYFEVHVGLNDLGIQRGHASPFSMMLDPLLPRIARQVRQSNRPLAVGRLARVDDTALPVPASLVCALTVGLGASGGFVSHYFLRGIDAADPQAMSLHVAQLRTQLANWAQAPPEKMQAAMQALRQAVERIAATAP